MFVTFESSIDLVGGVYADGLRARHLYSVPMGPFEQVFRGLEDARVRYVTVGGVATVLHGHVRLTRDIDLVVDLEATHARHAVEALTAMGYTPVAPVPAAQFADPATRAAWARDKHMLVFSMRDSRGETYVDLFLEYPVEWNALWRDSEIVPVGNTPIRVASLDHLIAMKRASDRPGDREDARQLQVLRALRRGDEDTGPADPATGPRPT